MKPTGAELGLSKRVRLFFCVGFFLITFDGWAQVFGISYIWTNSVSGNWTGVTNWFPNGVPGGNAGDTAAIGYIFGGTFTVTLNSSVTIAGLTVGQANGTQTLSVTNPGSLTVNGNVLIDTNGVLNLSGGALNSSTSSVIAGVFNWAGGTLGGTGSVTVASNGLMQILTASSNLLGTKVLNYGMTTWTNSSANLYFSRGLPAAILVNEPGGVFENRNGPRMAFTSGSTPPPSSAGFYNYGLFRKVGGNATTTHFQVPVTNNGTILAIRGNLMFENNLTLAASSDLQFPIGGIMPGTNFGTITIAPATPAIPPTLGTSGSLQLAGTLSVNTTNNYSPAAGTSFVLMTFPLKQAGFDAANLGAVSNAFFEVQLDTAAQHLIAVVRDTNPPPAQPPGLPDLTLAAGSTAVFSAPLIGFVPFAFQWQFNGTNLPGETNSTLTILNAQTNNSGPVCVSVVDALLQNSNTWCGSLSVYPLQSFTQQPSGVTGTNGGTIVLTAAVDSGLPVQYQWRCNGVNILGATAPSLTVTTNAQLWDGGAYDVLVGSAVGLIASTTAVVTVSSPALPFTNFPGGLITLSSYSNSLVFYGSGNNANATNLPGMPPIEGDAACNPVWLQLYKSLYSGDAVIELTTEGSTFDTLLAVSAYSGNSVTSLVWTASNDDGGRSVASRLLFLAQAGYTYEIAVGGFNGATGQVALAAIMNTNYTSLALPSSPQDLAVSSGGTATFYAAATNDPYAAYQWYKNGWLKIPGATNSTLTLSNVSPADVDVYSVTATGTNGQGVDSVRATLEIGPAVSFRKPELLARSLTPGVGNSPAFRFATPGPSGGFPSVAAGTIGFQLINNYNSLTSQNVPTTNAVGGASRYYLLTASNNAPLKIDTLGSVIPTTLVVYSNFISSPLWTTVASDANTTGNGLSLVNVNAVSNIAYLIEVDSPSGTQGKNINLDWRMGVPPNAFNPQQNLLAAEGANLPKLNAGENNNVTTPTYQWQLNGINIIGATNAMLSVTNISYNQCGSYSVIVSNLMGVVTNSIALVAVNAPLNLTQDAETKNFFIYGSATQAVVVQLNTNLLNSVWTTLYTNKVDLLPIDYLDVTSTNRNQGFYRLKSSP